MISYSVLQFRYVDWEYKSDSTIAEIVFNSFQKFNRKRRIAPIQLINEDN